MCEVNGSILGPGLIRHGSVQPFFSKCFACLVGPNKKMCLGLPLQKTLDRVGREFFFFFLYIYIYKCGLFCKRHLSRYDHILMFWNKFVYVITCTHDDSFIWCLSGTKNVNERL